MREGGVGIRVASVYERANISSSKTLVTYITATVPAANVVTADVIGTGTDICCHKAAAPSPFVFPHFLPPEFSRYGNWTDTLSPNVGKVLPLDAA
jgi:hypothetical protein